MNRMTRWDPVCHCYKAVREQEMRRSVIQELGVYESIHEEEIKKAVNIGDIRDMYFTGAAQLDPYWENFGKEKATPDNWIPVSERLPEDIKPVIVTWKNNDPKSYYQYIVGKHFIGTAHFKNGKWFWYSSVTEDLLAEYGKCDSEEFDEAIEVIAWMPLPLPWKGESKLDGDPIDIDKAIEHYDGTLEVLKGVGLEVGG